MERKRQREGQKVLKDYDNKVIEQVLTRLWQSTPSARKKAAERQHGTKGWNQSVSLVAQLMDNLQLAAQLLDASVDTGAATPTDIRNASIALAYAITELENKQKQKAFDQLFHRVGPTSLEQSLGLDRFPSPENRAEFIQALRQKGSPVEALRPYMAKHPDWFALEE